MYYELSDVEYEMLKKVSSITNTDYELKGNFIPVDSLMTAIDDILYEYHHKEEEIEDLKRDIEDNYEIKKFEPYVEYGVSEKDFL